MRIRKPGLHSTIVLVSMTLLLAGSLQAYAHTATPFAQNQGRWPADVAFHAQTTDGHTFVTWSGDLVHMRVGAANGLRRGYVVTERLSGARPAHVAGDVPSQIRISAFKGHAPTLHRGGASTYTTVSLGEIYTRIELKLRAHEGQVERYFILRPGADVQQIKLELDGPQDLSIATDGGLNLHTDCGHLAMSTPVAYQDIDGVRRPVDVAYHTDGLTYGFELGAYDPQAAVVIDPVLCGTYLGGTEQDHPFVVRTDAEGLVYVAGHTLSADYPTTTGAFDPEYNAGSDVFVAKFTADLETLLAATLIGGTNNEEACGLAVADNGDVIVGGNTGSADFPTTATAFQPAFSGGASDMQWNGGGDIWVARLNGNLDQLLASTYLGHTNVEYGRDLTLDADGNIYIVGFSRSLDFPVSDGCYDPSHNAGGPLGNDGIIARLSGDLTTLQASTYFGGRSEDYIEAIVLDSQGNVLVTGWEASSNFPTTVGAYDRTFNYGTYDGFVSKLDADLTTLMASTYCGGRDWDFGYAIDVDAQDNVYITGHTRSTTAQFFPSHPNGADTTYDGIGNTGDDAFVLKFDGDQLSTLMGATYFGSRNWECAFDLFVDRTQGCVYVAGATASTDLPVPSGALDTSFGGGEGTLGDGFIARFDLDLTTLEGATYLGGAGTEMIECLITSTDGSLLAVGPTQSVDFPTDAAGWCPDHNNVASDDAFVIRLTADLASLATDVAPPAELPGPTGMKSAYPNPFNPQVQIRFYVAEPRPVNVAVYDLAGCRVKTLSSGQLPAGNHQVVWNGCNAQGLAMPSGVYFLRLDSGVIRQTRKLTLVR